MVFNHPCLAGCCRSQYFSTTLAPPAPMLEGPAAALSSPGLHVVRGHRASGSLRPWPHDVVLYCMWSIIADSDPPVNVIVAKDSRHAVRGALCMQRTPVERLSVREHQHILFCSDGPGRTPTADATTLGQSGPRFVTFSGDHRVWRVARTYALLGLSPQPARL